MAEDYDEWSARRTRCAVTRKRRVSGTNLREKRGYFVWYVACLSRDMNLSSMVSMVAAIGLIVCAACSDLASDCAKANVSPAAACGNDNLQCPYNLDQPNCDGTSTTVSTSCVCTGGSWTCPSPVACADDAGATE